MFFIPLCDSGEGLGKDDRACKTRWTTEEEWLEK